MKQTRQLVTNAVLGSLSQPLNVLIAIVLTPIILNHLGEEQYGIWSLTGALLAYTSILRVGLNSVIDLHVPKYIQSGAVDKLNSLVTTLVLTYLVPTAIGAIFIGVLVWGFPTWCKVPAELWTSSRWVVLFAGVGVIGIFPLSVYAGVVTGLQRFEFVLGPRMASQVLRGLLIVVVFSFGAGLVSLGIISATCGLAAMVVTRSLAYRHCPGLKFRLSDRNWSLLPGFLAYSISTFAFASGQLLQFHSGKALAGFLFGPTSVTQFTIPFTLLIMIGEAIHGAARATKPAASSLEARGRMDRVRDLYSLTMKYAMLIAACAVAFLMLLGDGALKAWLGDADISEAAPLLMILAAPQMIRASQVPGFSILNGLGKHKFFGFLALASGAFEAGLAYFLAGPLNMGLRGIAWGYSAPELLISGVVIPWYCVRVLGVGPLPFLRRSVLPAVLGSLPFCAYCLVARVAFPTTGRAAFFAVCAGGVIFVAGGAWFFAFGREEKAIHGATVAKIWSRVSRLSGRTGSKKQSDDDLAT